jgi:hypothetical protein
LANAFSAEAASNIVSVVAGEAAANAAITVLTQAVAIKGDRAEEHGRSIRRDLRLHTFLLCRPSRRTDGNHLLESPAR